MNGDVASEDDRYGITPFAESIAKSILSIKEPIGTTIALNGPWGSGKSSAVNLAVRSQSCGALDWCYCSRDFTIFRSLVLRSYEPLHQAEIPLGQT